MFKKAGIVLLFILIFAGAVGYLFGIEKSQQPADKENTQAVSLHDMKADEVHRYTLDSLKADCDMNDKIFCAVEKTVKCTINPDFADCDKDLIPSFVLGKSEEVSRPTEIAFAVTKIKPVTDTSTILVYTRSECNALWFGLCNGTVVYSLSPKDEDWAVTNVFAME